MATLEAIKLFLSVEKVAFVLAADQEMVRESIAVSLDATGRGEQFALRYLEKIVQLPLSLPRISTRTRPPPTSRSCCPNGAAPRQTTTRS